MIKRYRNLNLRFNGAEATGASTPPAVETETPAEDAVVIVTPPKPGPPAGTAPAAPAAEPAAPPAAEAPAADAGTGEVEGSTDGGRTFSADYVEKLRKENAAARVENKTELQKQIDAALADGRQAWAKELGKQLGVLEAEDETPDPAKLIETVQAENTTLKDQLAARDARDAARAESDAIAAGVTTHEGDAELVAAWVKAGDHLKDIDRSATDYAAQVAAVIKEQIEKNPKLRAVQVAPRSGGDDTPTGDKPVDGDSIEALRKNRRERRGGQ